jgi:16S rRNA processing protein RimM
MDIESCYKIGWILKSHGLKGEVTLMLEDEAPDDLSAINSVFLEQNNRLVPYFIETVAGQGSKVFLKFEGIDSADAAKMISKQSVYLPKSIRPKRERGEFYDDEIDGFEVVDAGIGLLGKIDGVVVAGPNRLLSLEYHGKEVLIPTNGPFIRSINKSKKRIEVELPEGFLEI